MVLGLGLVLVRVLILDLNLNLILSLGLILILDRDLVPDLLLSLGLELVQVPCRSLCRLPAVPCRPFRHQLCRRHDRNWTIHISPCHSVAAEILLPEPGLDPVLRLHRHDHLGVCDRVSFLCIVSVKTTVWPFAMGREYSAGAAVCAFCPEPTFAVDRK